MFPVTLIKAAFRLIHCEGLWTTLYLSGILWSKCREKVFSSSGNLLTCSHCLCFSALAVTLGSWRQGDRQETGNPELHGVVCDVKAPNLLHTQSPQLQVRTRITRSTRDGVVRLFFYVHFPCLQMHSWGSFGGRSIACKLIKKGESVDRVMKGIPVSVAIPWKQDGLGLMHEWCNCILATVSSWKKHYKNRFIACSCNVVAVCGYCYYT